MVLILSLTGYERRMDKFVPTVAMSNVMESFGWLLSLTPFWLVFGMAIYEVFKAWRNNKVYNPFNNSELQYNTIQCLQPYESLFAPTEMWGSARHRRHLLHRRMLGAAADLSDISYNEHRTRPALKQHTSTSSMLLQPKINTRINA